ncbi:MAG: LysE family transporter [Pseudomonadota bacterium]
MIQPIFLFVFAGLFSPGPNVLMLTASGVRFGFGRTVPHLAGVVVGVGVIAAATGLGVGTALALRPGLELGLKIAAALWIAWMAWRLWQSSAALQDPAARPMTFVEATLFQWVNPKIWAVAMAAASGYPSGLAPGAEALRLAAIFAGLNLIVCLFWSATGAGLAKLLSQPAAWRLFARIMAILLGCSAAMVFL